MALKPCILFISNEEMLPSYFFVFLVVDSSITSLTGFIQLHVLSVVLTQIGN